MIFMNYDIAYVWYLFVYIFYLVISRTLTPWRADEDIHAKKFNFESSKFLIRYVSYVVPQGSNLKFVYRIAIR